MTSIPATLTLLLFLVPFALGGSFLRPSFQTATFACNLPLSGLVESSHCFVQLKLQKDHSRSTSLLARMDYTMEDTQNSAPDAHETTKLGSSAQRSDTQSVTKRFVFQHYMLDLMCVRVL